MARRRFMRRRTTHRRSIRHARRASHTPEHGILPVLFGASAAAIPFLGSSGGGHNEAFINDFTAFLQSGGQDAQAGVYALQDIPSALMNPDNLLSIAGLGALAALFSWGGKKAGLRKSTAVSRKWALF